MAAPAKPSASFFDHFDSLEDPRIERCRLHPLRDLVFIAVCALISSANDFVALEQFGRTRCAWLEKFLELPNGVPSHDPFGRVFAALDAEPLHPLLPELGREHPRNHGRAGRPHRRPDRAGQPGPGQGKHPLHVVSAWASANRLVLGEVMVDEKSNAITALPRLLEMLELRGHRDHRRHGLPEGDRRQGAGAWGGLRATVKGNQDPLEEDVIDHFAALDDGGGGRRRSRPTRPTRATAARSAVLRGGPGRRRAATGRPRPTAEHLPVRRASGVRRGRSDRRCITSSAACRGRQGAGEGHPQSLGLENGLHGCWTWFSRRTAAATARTTRRRTGPCCGAGW